MSETLLKILLSELNVVRVRCCYPGCGAIMEMPIEQLAFKFLGGNCPFCNKPFQPTQANKIVEFSRVVEALKSAPDRFVIEFVIPAGPEGE